jgi:hypothetical protein
MLRLASIEREAQLIYLSGKLKRDRGNLADHLESIPDSGRMDRAFPGTNEILVTNQAAGTTS